MTINSVKFFFLEHFWGRENRLIPNNSSMRKLNISETYFPPNGMIGVAACRGRPRRGHASPKVGVPTRLGQIPSLPRYDLPRLSGHFHRVYFHSSTWLNDPQAGLNPRPHRIAPIHLLGVSLESPPPPPRSPTRTIYQESI